MTNFKKPTNCKCGNYREVGDCWVVLERKELLHSSHLKCLRCGRKWWSSRKYVQKLADHRERSWSGLTDQDILDAVNAGKYQVSINDATIVSSTTGRPLRTITRTSNGSTYQFVEIVQQQRKKKIALHRLVWMVANNTTVPSDYDVDHVHGKEHGNGIDNLQLLSSSHNRSKGKPQPQQPQQPETLF